jgi:hypothetical protein
MDLTVRAHCSLQVLVSRYHYVLVWFVRRYVDSFSDFHNALLPPTRQEHALLTVAQNEYHTHDVLQAVSYVQIHIFCYHNYRIQVCKGSYHGCMCVMQYTTVIRAELARRGVLILDDDYLIKYHIANNCTKCTVFLT